MQYTLKINNTSWMSSMKAITLLSLSITQPRFRMTLFSLSFSHFVVGVYALFMPQKRVVRRPIPLVRLAVTSQWSSSYYLSRLRCVLVVCLRLFHLGPLSGREIHTEQVSFCVSPSFFISTQSRLSHSNLYTAEIFGLEHATISRL